MDKPASPREIFFTRLIWLFPLAFLFHIAEESNGFYTWVTKVIGGEMAMKSFYINNAVFIFVLLGLCFWTYKTRSQFSIWFLFLWVSGQQFWDAVFHVYAQARFGAYSPGLITSIGLYFPLYLFLTYKAIREKHLTVPGWLSGFVLGLPAFYMVLWGGLYHFKTFPFEKWF